MPIQITAIHKSKEQNDNPYLCINALAWIDDYTQNHGITPRDILFDWINNNGFAYILDELGNKAKLLTATSNSGYKYVRTVFDESKTDKLLTLPVNN